MTSRPVFAPSASAPRHAPPSPDQAALGRRVNDQLLNIGARVDFFTLVHPDRREFGAVFQCGAKRRTLLRSHPFDDEQELVEALRKWANSGQRGALYGYEPPEDFDPAA